MIEKSISGEHTVIIENRSKMNLSGVLDVLSFDEQTVVLKTELGELTIKGDNLKVNSFAVETGSLLIDGNFSALAYTVSNKRNFASRLFG